MTRSLILSTAATALVLALAAPAAAGTPIINFPPAGSRSFVALSEIDSGLASCPHIQCEIVSSSTVSTTMAPVTFQGSNPLNFLTGSGATGPNALHAFVTGRDPGEVDAAFEDTYTVHGGTGPFAITVTMTGHAIASTFPLTPTFNFMSGQITGHIGAFDINPANLFPAVDPFDFTSTGSASVNLSGPSPFSRTLGFTATHTRIVNPGDVFDIAYELSVDGFGTFDATNTADITFALPDGVFLSAASGATFGDVPPPPSTGVPEPASWALMIAGFGLAGAALRRRPRFA